MDQNIGKKHERLLLLGYIGMRNAGDDALVYCLTRLIKAWNPTVDITVQSPVHVVMPDAIDIRYDLIPRIPIVKRFLWRLSVQRTDSLVWSGGGILYHHGTSGHSVANLTKIGDINAFAKAHGKNVYMLGISAGPIDGEKARREALRIIGNADCLSIRDSESIRILGTLGLRPERFIKCMDPAILLANEPIRHDTSKSPNSVCLGVALRPIFSWMEQQPSKDTRYLESVCTALRRLAGHIPNLQVKVFVFQDKSRYARGDRQISESLVHMLKEVAVSVELTPYNPDPRYMLAEVAKCSHMLAVRYHAGVFAYMRNLPLLLVDYQPKASGFARDIGLERNCLVGLNELLDSVCLEDKLIWLIKSSHRCTLDVREAIRLASLAMPELNVDKPEREGRHTYSMDCGMVELETRK